MSLEKLVTDEQIESVFRNTNFGITPHRDVIKWGLLKASCGFSDGHTARCCMAELGLIKTNPRGVATLTRKGMEYMWEAFNEGYK